MICNGMHTVSNPSKSRLVLATVCIVYMSHKRQYFHITAEGISFDAILTNNKLLTSAPVAACWSHIASSTPVCPAQLYLSLVQARLMPIKSV